jgi:hypothetical protein
MHRLEYMQTRYVVCHAVVIQLNKNLHWQADLIMRAGQQCLQMKAMRLNDASNRRKRLPFICVKKLLSQT